MGRRSLGLVIMAACAPTFTAVSPGPEFELAHNGTVRLGGTGVELTMLGVASDSRCPADAVCVWAGSAEVRFRVRSGASDTTISLHTMQEPRAVTLGAVRLELTGLVPENRAATAIPPDRYLARLRWTAP